jgi:hypothetical protein
LVVTWQKTDALFEVLRVAPPPNAVLEGAKVNVLEGFYDMHIKKKIEKLRGRTRSQQYRPFVPAEADKLAQLGKARGKGKATVASLAKLFKPVDESEPLTVPFITPTAPTAPTSGRGKRGKKRRGRVEKSLMAHQDTSMSSSEDLSSPRSQGATGGLPAITSADGADSTSNATQRKRGWGKMTSWSLGATTPGTAWRLPTINLTLRPPAPKRASLASPEETASTLPAIAPAVPPIQGLRGADALDSPDAPAAAGGGEGEGGVEEAPETKEEPVKRPEVDRAGVVRALDGLFKRAYAANYPDDPSPDLYLRPPLPQRLFQKIR